jgi:copper transport protein
MSAREARRGPGAGLQRGPGPGLGTSERRRWWNVLLAAAGLITVLAALAGLGIGVTAQAARAAISAPGVTAARVTPVRFAHAALASTYPADGSVLPAEPAQVSATFDQPIGITPASLEVYTPDGNRADDGDATLVNPEELAVTLLPGLGHGTYTAVWHVISADTHPVSGAFTFSIGTPSATQVPALAQAPNTLVSVLFTVVRAVEYASFALLGGAVAFLITCWPAGASRRGVIRLVTVSWAALLLSTLGGLLLQGPYAADASLGQVFSPPLVRSTLSSTLGSASQARELMAFLAGGGASLLLPRLGRAGRRARIAGGAAWAILTTAVAASWAVYDHASTGVQAPGGGVTADVVHLDAMAVWIGGLAVLAGFALRAEGGAGARARDEAGSEAGDGGETGGGDDTAAAAVERFSQIALACVAALVVSGAYQTWREVGTWDALADTSYGRLILAKIAGLGLLIGLGYLARRFIRRGLRPAAGTAGTALRRLRVSVAVELAVAAVILALTAVLVNTATGRESYAPTVTASRPFSTSGPGGTGVVHVFIGPARLGPNTIDVYFTQGAGRGYVPAQVTAALYDPARNLGPIAVPLAQTAPGQYRTQLATLTFTGQWSLAVTVRSDAFDETTVSFSFGVH